MSGNGVENVPSGAKWTTGFPKAILDVPGFKGCCGGFIDPLADVTEPVTDDTQFEASAGLTQQTANSVDLGGEVTVTQGARRIVNSGEGESTSTTIDRAANTIDMQGLSLIHISEPTRPY